MRAFRGMGASRFYLVLAAVVLFQNVERCNSLRMLKSALGKRILNGFATGAIALASLTGPATFADDELAQFAAEGNKVEVDSMCFMRKCMRETTECGNDPNCLKGLSCLARCKGESVCSTGCFASHGSETLNRILYCSVEKEDCVKVPRDETRSTWAVDPSHERPLVVKDFDMSSLEGSWYKVMGWDQRYDCFDCQMNSFKMPQRDGALPSPARAGLGSRLRRWEVPNAVADDEIVDERSAARDRGNDGLRMDMEVRFTMPRPRDAKGYRNSVQEEIIGDAPDAARSMHSRGRMFGLTFWENYYVVAEGNADGSFTTGLGRYSKSGSPLGQTAPEQAVARWQPEDASMYVESLSFDDPAPKAGAKRAQRPPELPSLPAKWDPHTTLTGTPVRAEGDAWKFIYYTGHTLQGNYKGAFVYSRTPQLSPKYEAQVAAAARQVGLDITQFCRIRNQCFLNNGDPYEGTAERGAGEDAVPQVGAAPGKTVFPIFRVTRQVAEELSDWFGDPTIVSDWLLAQQERVVLQQPLETSPFADLIPK